MAADLRACATPERGARAGGEAPAHATPSASGVKGRNRRLSESRQRAAPPAEEAPDWLPA